MKFLLRGENQNPDVGDIPVCANVPAVRCDAVALRLEDVQRLYRMLNSGSHVEAEFVREILGGWLCRFVP